MKKLLFLLLFVPLIAFAAPTSTVVVNLRITSTTSLNCLGTDSTGLVGQGTCTGGGSSGSVSTSSPISVNDFPFWVTTGGALSGTSTLTIQGGNINASGTISSNGTLVMLQGGNITLLTNNAGYITTSTGLSPLNFTSTNISQWTNDAAYAIKGVTTSSNLTAGQWVIASGVGTVYSTSSQPTLQFGVNGPLLSVSSVSATGTEIFTISTSSLNLGTASNQNIAFFLQSANNLSDLANVSSSLVNLRLSTSSLVTFGSIVVNSSTFINASGTNETLSGYISANNGYFNQIYDNNVTSSPCINTNSLGLEGAVNCVNTLNSLTGTVIATGTTNQIAVSSSSGNLVFSIPTQFSITNASLTNITASGYLQGIAYDSQGNKYTTSTVANLGTIATSSPWVTNALVYTITANGNKVNATTSISVLADGTVSSTAMRVASGTIGSLYDFQGNKYSTSTNLSTSTFSLGVTFDGGGSVISSNASSVAGYFPYSGTIRGWNMSSDVVCTSSFDIWKASKAIPTVANRIAGTDVPKLGGQQINSSTALTGWTTSFSVGDYFMAVATGTITACTKAAVQIIYSKN